MKMISGKRFFTAASCLAVMMLLAPDTRADGPSAADIETARTLYQEGKQLLEAGDHEAAVKKFLAANALASTPITGLYLARAYEKVGKLVEARETALSIGRLAIDPSETERSAQARQEAAELARQWEPRIPSLTVQLKEHSQDVAAIVTIDGQQIPQVAIGQVRKVNPGPHVVTVSAPGRDEAKYELTLGEGESRVIEIAIPEEPAAESPTSAAATKPMPAKSSRPKTMMITGFTMAGVGLTLGALAGLQAMKKESELRDQCPNHQCPPEVHKQLEEATEVGTLATVSVGVAVVGATVAIIGFVQGRKTQPQKAQVVSPWVGVGSAGLQGAF